MNNLLTYNEYNKINESTTKQIMSLATKGGGEAAKAVSGLGDVESILKALSKKDGAKDLLEKILNDPQYALAIFNEIIKLKTNGVSELLSNDKLKKLIKDKKFSQAAEMAGKTVYENNEGKFLLEVIIETVKREPMKFGGTLLKLCAKAIISELGITADVGAGAATAGIASVILTPIVAWCVELTVKEIGVMAALLAATAVEMLNKRVKNKEG